jgi:hypothetical protein
VLGARPSRAGAVALLRLCLPLWVR